ncbi:hypothetical protein C8J56DRAFT_897167 [Mycena floridula]|nr:hypothetical protein C8J56DRAFT_897167 [Mycena floridula]
MHLRSQDAATSFVTPSTWRKPGILTEPAVRVSLAQAAIAESVARLNLTTGQLTAILYSQMATFDLITNQTIYKDQLKTLFTLSTSLLDSSLSNEEFTQDCKTYGYGAALAYAAYKDPSFLAWAQQNWQFGYDFTISQQQIDVTEPNRKNFTLQALCDGLTMAGGSFRNTDVNDPDINALSTGGVLINSGLLAESTRNATYLSVAQASARFVDSHLLSAKNVVLDTISAHDIDKCAITNNNLYPYNHGLVTEGLAILASLDTSNADTQNIMSSTILVATNNPDFHTSDGIILIPRNLMYISGIGSDRLIRGAIAAYNRNPANKDLRSYLRNYIGVQYNAVIDLATTGNNIYSATWSGDPQPVYSTDGQSMAISVLLAGISTQNDTAMTNSTGPSSPTIVVPHGSLVGPIAGGVVGAVVLIVVIISTMFFFQRRRRQSSASPRNVIDEYILSPSPANNTQAMVSGAFPQFQFKETPTDHQPPPGAEVTSPTQSSSAQTSDSRQIAEELIRMVAARLQYAPAHELWAVQSPPSYQALSPGAQMTSAVIPTIATEPIVPGQHHKKDMR